MINTTLCYITRGDEVLMLHRVKKEKDLNIAANVLSVGATAASISATVFNATQIAAIKKVAGVSEKCTGVLK